MLSHSWTILFFSKLKNLAPVTARYIITCSTGGLHLSEEGSTRGMMWTKRTAVGLVWLCFKQYVFAGSGDKKTFPRLMGIESRDVIFSLNIGGVKTQYKCFFAIHCWRHGLMVIHWFWVIALLYFWQGIAGRLVVLGSVE